MHLHLNPLGGLAGDMFCAALLDAHPNLLPNVLQAVAAVPMPRDVRIDLVPADGLLSGKRFRVSLDGHGRTTEHRHHTPFLEIRGLLADAQLESGVRDRALSIFALLAAAEAEVHGTNPEEVVFHEVGAWDSIADILSAAVLLETLGVVSVSCAPLPLGSGRVRSAHGLLPVPAPATALLLKDLPVSYDGIEGERVTPTGAAILKSLGPQPTVPAGAVLHATGMGFGTRRLPGMPNCLQVLHLETDAAANGLRTDRVELLSFEIDDQSPEDLALGLDRLRATGGVLSVTTLQAIGKKGRPTMLVEILARPDRLDTVVEACFRETSTIGLRHQCVDRLILFREQRSISVEGRNLGVKVTRRPDGATAKTESDDLAGVEDHQERARLRREATESALTLAKAAEENANNG